MRKCWIGSKGKDEEPRFGCENSWTQGMCNMGRISKDLGEKKQAPMHQADYSRRKVLEAATRPATRMHAEEYRCSLSFIQLMSWLMQHSQEI